MNTNDPYAKARIVMIIIWSVIMLLAFMFIYRDNVYEFTAFNGNTEIIEGTIVGGDSASINYRGVFARKIGGNVYQYVYRVGGKEYKQHSYTWSDGSKSGEKNPDKQSLGKYSFDEKVKIQYLPGNPEVSRILGDNYAIPVMLSAILMGLFIFYLLGLGGIFTLTRPPVNDNDINDFSS